VGLEVICSGCRLRAPETCLLIIPTYPYCTIYDFNLVFDFRLENPKIEGTDSNFEAVGYHSLSNHYSWDTLVVGLNRDLEFETWSLFAKTDDGLITIHAEVFPPHLRLYHSQ